MILIELILSLFNRAISTVPPKLLAYALGASLLVGIGWYLRDMKADQERLEAVSEAIRQADEQHQIDMAILEDSVELQREIEVRYVTIEKEAERIPVPECTDTTDWLRVYNDAIRKTGSLSTYQ